MTVPSIATIIESAIAEELGMSREKKGFLRLWAGRLWALVDGTRRAVFNLLWLALLIGVPVALLMGRAEKLEDKTVLVLDLAGPLVEQGAGGTRDTLLRQVQGQDQGQVRLRDLVRVLDAAARDPKIERALLLPEELSGGGLSAQREVAAALERFKASGKQVVAWGTRLDQRQYYLAAHASDVYIHPMGTVTLQGYGRLRNYYRQTLDRVGVSANVVRVGKYKNAAEPFFASAPSKETLEAEAYLYDALWSLYTRGVEKARKLPEGAIAQGIAALPGSLQALQGDTARLALESRLVDGLKTRDELRAMLIERGAEDPKAKTFRQIGWREYLSRQKPAASGPAIGVVVAEGEIGEGSEPPGRIGGRSTAELIRKARNDDEVKAVVLRVNSPGGSALGSELIRRELELTRAAGKPVVVSMGDVAASGGYWIALAADEVIADRATITGSIGVFGMLPTAQGLMDKLSVGTGGHATTWLATGYDPRRPLDPRFEQLVQSVIGRTYTDFIAKAAAARKTTPGKIDAVAQGRVWTGTQALERGLIDRNGAWSDALKAAAARAKLPEDARLRWMEREPGRLEQLAGFFKSTVAASVQQALGLGAPGLPVSGLSGAAPAGGLLDAGTQALQDLVWLHDLAQRRRPFDAVVHCLCAAD
ncbi:MAG: signal peptide peptidase SppA [Rubrivivax sp.]|nr:signal peptide peptidase SppA [Rubrivivax sp.]